MHIYTVPFDFCNLASVNRAIKELGFTPCILKQNTLLDNSDCILIPGVGTFGQGISFLESSGLFSVVQQHFSNGGRILGICLGMQLLFDRSSESHGYKGLSLLEGNVEQIKPEQMANIPHMGWNEIHSVNVPKFKCLNKEKYIHALDSDYYFVHSYYCSPSNNSCLNSRVQCNGPVIPAIVSNESCIGFQFHPEKSGPAGTILLRAVLDL